MEADTTVTTQNTHKSRSAIVDFYERDRTGWILLGVVCGIYLLLNYLSNMFIFTDEFYYRSLSGQLTASNIDTFLGSRNRLWWVGYMVQPFMVLLKVLFAVVCVSIGVILADIDFKLKEIFKAGVTAEFIFITAQILFLFNLYINRDFFTFETISDYYPFTVLGLIGTENVISWMHYPLQVVNLFEVSFVLFFSWLLSRSWKPNFVETLNIVVPSYGLGLILWIALLTFLTLQIS